MCHGMFFGYGVQWKHICLILQMQKHAQSVYAYSVAHGVLKENNRLRIAEKINSLKTNSPLPGERLPPSMMILIFLLQFT